MHFLLFNLLGRPAHQPLSAAPCRSALGWLTGDVNSKCTQINTQPLNKCQSNLFLIPKLKQKGDSSRSHSSVSAIWGLFERLFLHRKQFFCFFLIGFISIFATLAKYGNYYNDRKQERRKRKYFSFYLIVVWKKPSTQWGFEPMTSGLYRCATTTAPEKAIMVITKCAFLESLLIFFYLDPIILSLQNHS